MTAPDIALYSSIAAGAVSVVYGLGLTAWVLKFPTGSEKMQEIATAIQQGASAYMKRQYMTVAAVAVALFLIIGFGLGWRWDQ